MDHRPEPDRSKSADKFILRMHDDGLRRHLKIRAAQNERTLNAEIVYLVKRGLSAEGDPLPAQAEAAQ